MATYIRADSDTPRAWVVAWGVPALILAVGFAMTGFIHFWLGIVLMAIALVAMSLDLWLKHKNWERRAKLRSVAVLWVAYLTFLWVVFVAAPLVVLIDRPPGNYPASTSVYGVQWKSEYYPVNYVLLNDTDNDYSNFDSYVYTSASIAKVGIKRSINQCVASLEAPNMHFAIPRISYEENGETVVIPTFQEDQETRATTYRIRCDKLAGNSRIEIVLATVGKPDWAGVQSSYSAAGRVRNAFVSKMFYFFLSRQAHEAEILRDEGQCFPLHSPQLPHRKCQS